jgi:hypothetical protein
MPRVNVTSYEYEQDLLPMVCAKCGRPAEDRVFRLIRHLDCDERGFLAGGVVLGLLAFPPLFFFIALRFSEKIRVRIPMCETHRGDWKWRDRAEKWFVFPVWVVGVFFLYAIGGMYMFKGDTENATASWACIPGAFFVLAFVENVIILFGAVRVTKPAKQDGIRLAGVHEEFVAALTEDRARDRVDNPERRCVPRADMQDDFDDELL